MTRRETADYKAKIKALRDDELFAEWSAQYDAKRIEHVTLVVAEMDVRKLGGVIQL